jgi:hypothetical protein
VSASDGNVFIRPRWLAGQTYGGTEWCMASPAVYFYVRQKLGSATLVKPGGEWVNVASRCGSATASQNVFINSTWTLASQVQTALASAIAGVAAQVEPECPGYYAYGSYLIRGLPGQPPETRITITHSDFAASGFEVMLAGLTEQNGSVEGSITGGSQNGPGINYLTVDVGAAELDHVFQVDTSDLAEGTHEVMVVAVDGGPAEAQGACRTSFTVTRPIAASASWRDGWDWCFENTPITTQNRHECYLQLAVAEDPNGNAAYTSTVTVAPSSTGKVTVEATVDPLLWRIVSGLRSDGAAGSASQIATVELTAEVHGADVGGTGTVSAVMVVRRLGDVNGNGVVDTTDQSYMNQRLNSLWQPLADRAFDFSGNGVVDTTDRMVLQNIMNSLLVP